MSQTIRLLSSEEVAPRMLEQILREVPGVEWIASAGADATADELASADIAFGLVPAKAIPRGSRLRWIQYPFAGIARGVCERALEESIVITNVSGIYDRTIAEHVLAMMLYFARRLDICLELQREGIWAHPFNPYIEDLAGQTAAIVGMGSLGQAIARRLKFLGMRVIGARRSPRPTPHVDQLFERSDLPTIASQARWLILALPSTPETDGLVDRRVLASLPAGSRVINVGRGATLDHDALADLLHAGHLAGAGLDVLPDEPLSRESLLWRLPRTLITPHCSANPADASTLPAEVLLWNLHRFVSGEPLRNVVDCQRGY
jgi:phosphoglycerate dehydrogenase-like enzyme